MLSSSSSKVGESHDDGKHYTGSEWSPLHKAALSIPHEIGCFLVTKRTYRGDKMETTQVDQRPEFAINNSRPVKLVVRSGLFRQQAWESLCADCCRDCLEWRILHELG